MFPGHSSLISLVPSSRGLSLQFSVYEQYEKAPGERELTSFLISGFPSVLTIIFCIKYGTLPERWLLETSTILRLGRDVSSFGKVPESVLFERINCSIDVSIEKSEEIVPWSSNFWKLTTLVFLTSLHKIRFHGWEAPQGLFPLQLSACKHQRITHRFCYW